MKKFIVFEYTIKSDPYYSENGFLIGYDRVETLIGIAKDEDDFNNQIDPQYMYDVRVIGKVMEYVVRTALASCPVS